MHGLHATGAHHIFDMQQISFQGLYDFSGRREAAGEE
jgi:hypothetical protein